ncbi:MAG: hypothetical protein U0930_16430 [Pirellulales bacterium]
MADSSILERISTRRDALDHKFALDDESLDDLGAFGWLRGVKDRAIMLEFRKRDGHTIAFNYSWLERAEYDPTTGIILRFGRHEVRITGTNLDKEIRPQVQLFSGIVRHRVPWVQEETEFAKCSFNVQIERINVS